MTRHPLALLDLLIRVNAAAQNPGEECAELAEEFAAVMVDPATGEQLRALRAQAEAEDGLQAENAALRRKISRIESLKRFMAEQIARRTPASFYEAVAELDRALAEPLYDPQTGALAQAQAGAGEKQEEE